MPAAAHVMASPVGPLRLVAGDGALVAIEFVDEAPAPEAPAEALLAAARGQLEEYFAGRRRRFDLPLAPEGSDFERAVWDCLRNIPFGTTRSYAAIAAELGRPGAARAVGAANGRNPIAIVVPCHRVVGADGSLTGYGGGLERKRHLLALEGARLATVAQGELGLPEPSGR